MPGLTMYKLPKYSTGVSTANMVNCKVWSSASTEWGLLFTIPGREIEETDDGDTGYSL